MATTAVETRVVPTQWVGFGFATIGALVSLGALNAYKFAGEWERDRYCDETYVTAMGAMGGLAFGLAGAILAMVAYERAGRGPTPARSRSFRNLSVLLGVIAVGLAPLLLFLGFTGVCNM
jgi:hypothetical protein